MRVDSPMHAGGAAGTGRWGLLAGRGGGTQGTASFTSIRQITPCMIWSELPSARQTSGLLREGHTCCERLLQTASGLQGFFPSNGVRRAWPLMAGPPRHSGRNRRAIALSNNIYTAPLQACMSDLADEGSALQSADSAPCAAVMELPIQRTDIDEGACGMCGR